MILIMICPTSYTTEDSMFLESPIQDEEEGADWLKTQAVAGLKLWQLLFAIATGVATIVIFLCCCIRFRIPRTKEEIEADYMRKKIALKFRRQLRLIQNADMDDMDLKRALDRVRAEFKSDTESLARSEALSIGSVSSAHSSAYRKASDILQGMSLENLPQERTIATRFTQLVYAALVTLRLRKRNISHASVADLVGQDMNTMSPASNSGGMVKTC